MLTHVLDEEEEPVPLPPFLVVPGPSGEAGPSTRPSLSDSLALVRKRRVEDKRRVDRLQPEARQQLKRMRATKERGFFLMPDAPPKRGRKASPVRVECPLKEGTPSEPPPRIAPGWERVNSSTERPSSPTSTPRFPSPTPTPQPLSPTPTPQPPSPTPTPQLPSPTPTPQPPSPTPTPQPPTPSRRRVMPEFSPSTGIRSMTWSEASSAGLNLLDVDVDLSGFTPESSLVGSPHHRRASASSAYPGSPQLFEDIGVRAEGSDDEDDIAVESADHFVFDVESDVLQLDAAEDEAIREMSSVTAHDLDVTNFNWVQDVSAFTGKKETFEGPSGPTFAVNGETPLSILNKIWDVEIMQLVVDKTNKYARQFLSQNRSANRMARWHDTDVDEMWVYFAILMVQSLAPLPVEKEYWYPVSDITKMPNFPKIMSYDRFILLKKCLHFADNSQIVGTSKEEKRLAKIRPLIEHTRAKFVSLFMPGQEISLDESLLMWKGRLSFAQLIANKRAKVGIKSYELCDAKTGYLWDYRIYTGKSNVSTEHENEPQNEPHSATSKIVFDLVRPLLGRGHVLVMDNFYNAPLLSRLLKLQKTDTMGTLRLNREFVPNSLKLSKSDMRQGEVAFSQTRDMSIVVWRDANIVSMISTFHEVQVAGKEKHGRFYYKPQVVLDYNQSMGGVDKKDQLLSAFPMERTRNIIWYKKLFRRLLNISIMNAWIIFCADNTTMQARRFRQNLVDEILAKHKRGWAPSGSVNVVVRRTPIERLVEGGHYPKKSESKAHRCKWCSMHGRVSRTVWMCDVCDVSLCIEHCFKDYHTKQH